MIDDSEFLKKLNEELARTMEDANSRPVEEMDFLSPNDMQHILRHTFEKQSPIGFKDDIDISVLDQIPMLNLVIAYLKIIEENKEIKLTKIGNLPTKFVYQLYELGVIKEYPIESGIVKLKKEDDSMTIQLARFLTELIGATKKRNNKLSLTANGKKMLATKARASLLKAIFKANCQKYNLGFFDGFDESDIQGLFGFTLYLLIKYGNENKGIDFYCDKNLIAFPILLSQFDSKYNTSKNRYQRCYILRIFERFLKYYNFVDYEFSERYSSEYRVFKMQTTSIFDAVFEMRNENFKFKKAKNQA